MALPIPSITGGAGGAAGPARADSSANTAQSIFDSSGWTVSTGSSKAAAGLGASAGGIPLMWIAAALVVGYVLWKKR